MYTNTEIGTLSQKLDFFLAENNGRQHGGEILEHISVLLAEWQTIVNFPLAVLLNSFSTPSSFDSLDPNNYIG